MLFRWSILIAVIPNTNHKLLRLAVLLVLAVFFLFHSFYLEQWSVKLAHLTKSGISYLCWVLTNKHILQRPCQNSLSRSSTPGPPTEPTRPGGVMSDDEPNPQWSCAPHQKKKIILIIRRAGTNQFIHYKLIEFIIKIHTLWCWFWIQTGVPEQIRSFARNTNWHHKLDHSDRPSW